MEIRRAGDIMMPLSAFPYIPHWFTLREAMMETAGGEVDRDSSNDFPSIILVFDATGKFLGIVQRQDIWRGLRSSGREGAGGADFPYQDAPVDPNLSRLSFSAEKSLRELKDQTKRQIIEIMQPVRIAVEYDDPAVLAVHLMIDHKLTFVAVVQNGQVVGILYIEDALDEVFRHIK